jgi:glycosyltransferase involved in cell wall biosynthesis
VKLAIAHLDGERGFSGGEVQVLLLMEGLRRRGHRNVLFCPPGSASEAECRRRGFRSVAVPMRNQLDWRAVRGLARGFREEGIDLVHANTGRDVWLGALAARRCGLPAVATRRMDRRVAPGLRTRLLYGTLVRRVAAIAPAVADCLREGGVDPARVDVIEDAVDPERTRPSRPREAMRDALGVAPDEVLVLGVGALFERKGWDVLLEAFAALAPDVRDRSVLRIAGDGPEREALRTRLEALGLEKRAGLLGFRDDVGDLLHASDVFVLPSRREGLGVACLEAMATGLPVVASRVGGLGQVIDDGETGLLAPPADPAPLADALARLVCDPDLRDRLGKAARARVLERYLPDRLVDAYLAFYERALQG